MTDVDLSVDELAAKRLREAPLRKWLRERGVYAPADLGEITRLSANGSTLPAEIGQLVNLKTLYADGSTLPAEIGQLVNLEMLSADGSTLPAEIGQLVNLKTLYAADSTLPKGGIITDSKYIASVIARLRKASK